MGSNQMMMARLVDEYQAQGMSYEDAFNKAANETAVKGADEIIKKQGTKSVLSKVGKAASKVGSKIALTAKQIVYGSKYPQTKSLPKKVQERISRLKTAKKWQED